MKTLLVMKRSILPVLLVSFIKLYLHKSIFHMISSQSKHPQKELIPSTPIKQKHQKNASSLLHLYDSSNSFSPAKPHVHLND